ncbi:hypothetical protein FCH28_22075 [Streptomyces piniterrae]|uniref:DUF6286 domain-containing protein n=1 Tax=Streptomyces piniterrae TaxID=2571125 RepID=A0A4V5MJZ7_9ACTN|nr:DUF6286 domain-containing protein [Streptomyces piniterrae]TJZ51178.1 hypothetical protein FCH28_22075 [Streptomyces piniterrae]
MSDDDAQSADTRRLPTLEKQPGDGGGLEQSESSAAYTDPADGHGARRFWSARRVPAGLVALVLLGAAGLLLYDVIAVRAGRQAMAWRIWLAGKLDTVHLDSPWELGGASAAMLIGIWLIVLAVSPGLRELLPMRRTAPGIRAGLDRSAAALVLRDRAMEIAGVQSVRMTVGRRKVTARAVSHFRELDEVRGDLDEALGEGLRQLGLTHPLHLSVHVRRPKKG